MIVSLSMNASHYNSAKLALAREQKQLTQKNIAEKLGVTEMTVYRAEKGINASYELLVKFCELVDLDIREILVLDKAKNFSFVA